MSEYKISDSIIVTDVERCEWHLKKELPPSEEINILEILSQVKNNTKYFIDSKFNYSTEDNSSSKYLWIDTGVVSSSNKPIFVSFLKGSNDIYEGYFVGVPKTLVETILKYYPSNSRQIRNNYSAFCSDVVSKIVPESQPEEIEIVPVENVLDLTKDIYAQLIYNSWETVSGLDRFLKIIGNRLLTLIGEGKTEYYILNNIKSAIVNTGLIGRFNEDILIMYRYNMSKNCYSPYKQISTKKQMLDEEFSKEQVDVVNLSPIRFFDGDGLLRNVSISDFDINPRSLEHIISERRDRFPKDIADCPSDVLAIKIYDSLNTGLKMLERDFTYAKPSYSAKLNGISWFLPLHIFTSFSEEPELVMVIKKDVEDLYYEVRTILPYDNSVKDRITAVALYRKYW